MRLIGALVVLAALATPALAGPETRVRGLVSAKQHTILSSQLAGRLARLESNTGDRFRKGNVLAAIDCDVQRAQVAEHRAELNAAETAMGVQRQLAGLKSGSTLDAAMAEGNVGKARARLALASATAEMCEIRAPFDGRVVDRRVEPFQHVAAGQAVLEVQDDTVLEVEIIVPSQWVAWLKPGSPFAITVDETGKDYAGKLTRLGVRIDPASQSLKVVGELSGAAGDLLPGMSGTARFNP